MKRGGIWRGRDGEMRRDGVEDGGGVEGGGERKGEGEEKDMNICMIEQLR